MIFIVKKRRRLSYFEKAEIIQKSYARTTYLRIKIIFSNLFE